MRATLPAPLFGESRYRSLLGFDGQLETMLTILQEMGFYEDLIRREVDQQLPFLATTTILMAAVRRRRSRAVA